MCLAEINLKTRSIWLRLHILTKYLYLQPGKDRWLANPMYCFYPWLLDKSPPNLGVAGDRHLFSSQWKYHWWSCDGHSLPISRWHQMAFYKVPSDFLFVNPFWQLKIGIFLICFWIYDEITQKMRLQKIQTNTLWVISSLTLVDSEGSIASFMK